MRDNSCTLFSTRWISLALLVTTAMLSTYTKKLIPENSLASGVVQINHHWTRLASKDLSIQKKPMYVYLQVEKRRLYTCARLGHVTLHSCAQFVFDLAYGYNHTTSHELICSCLVGPDS